MTRYPVPGLRVRCQVSLESTRGRIERLLGTRLGCPEISGQGKPSHSAGQNSPEKGEPGLLPQRGSHWPKPQAPMNLACPP